MIKCINIHLFFDLTFNSREHAEWMVKLASHNPSLWIPSTDSEYLDDIRDVAICAKSVYFTATYTGYCFNDDIFLGFLERWADVTDGGLLSMKLLVNQFSEIEGDMSYYACYEYDKAYDRLWVSYLYHDPEESELDAYMFDAKHTYKSMAASLLREHGKERKIDLADGAYGAYLDQNADFHSRVKETLDWAKTKSKHITKKEKTDASH